MALFGPDAEGFGRRKRPHKIVNEITPPHLETLTAGAILTSSIMIPYNYKHVYVLVHNSLIGEKLGFLNI